MSRHRLSLLVYRCLLRGYPREFRARFRADSEADFVEMLHTLGTAAAWRRIIADLFRAVPLTTNDAMTERARAARIGGPILPPGESTMGSVLFDLRHAVRALLKAPAFTVVTVVTLALGIGANTAVFSLVNAVLLRPLGYQDPERLMLIYETLVESGVSRFDVSPPDYIDLVEYQRSFSGIGAYRTRSFELSGRNDPEQIRGAEVTPGVFSVLGVDAAQGRGFVEGQDQQETNVAVISHALWTRRFGQGEIIGQPLVVDRTPYTVIGIMPEGFEFPKRGASSNAEPADVWLPLVFSPFERQARGSMYNHSVIARLRDGVTFSQAAADTEALAARIHENYPVVLRNVLTLKIGTTRFVDEISGQVRRPLLILLGAVGLVLLVACANAGNLILSRSISRQREIGVRAALGAGALRLFQILLIEGLLLAVCGGALGLAAGYWAVRAVPAVIATSLPGVTDVPIDWRVLLFTAGLSLGTAAAFALVPLGGGFRRDLQGLLRTGSDRTVAGRGQHRIQTTLVVSSVAFAFILLVGAGLLIKSFRTLLAVDSGLRASNVLTMKVRLPLAGYQEASRIRSFYRLVEERLRGIPGVRAASIASDLPLEGDGERRVFTPETADLRGLPPSVALTWVHGDYFATYGIPLVKGRPFSSAELTDDRRAAIVSRRLADTYWPGEDPIGRRLKWGLPASPTRWHTVVGVAGDVVDGPPGSEPVIHVYVPYAEASDALLQAPTSGLLRGMVIAIASDQDTRAFAGAARAAVAAIDPVLAVSNVRAFDRIEHDRSAPQRFSATVLSGFAMGALLLAAIGLYGVLSQTVAHRKREIGVRLALGASPREVIRLVVAQGMGLVATGLLFGAAAAIAATRLLRAMLFETNVYDPLTFGIVPVLLAVVALLACYLPARRASMVDPSIALRAE